MLPRTGAPPVPIRNSHFIRAVIAIFALIAAVFAVAPWPAAGQSSSKEAQNLIQEGRAAGAKGNWEQAAASYQQAIRLLPRDAGLRVEYGAALANSGRLTEAIASYEEALRISPRNLAAELGLAKAYRGVHNYEETRRVLERACREHPKSGAPLGALGDLEIELQTFEAAIGHLRAAVTLDPTNMTTRNYLAAAYQAKGDQESALVEISKVLARDPENALAYFQRAEIYSAQNGDERALPDAEKASALQPQNPRARVLLGKILLRNADGAAGGEAAGICGKAVAALQPLLEVKAGDSETLFLLSRAYRCAGQAAEAQKTLEEFEAASQRDRTTKQEQHEAEHLVEQANNLAIKNDLPGALDLLRQAIAKDASYSPAYSLFAKLYYSAGDLEKASEAISRALEISPYVPDFLYVQGKILEKEGKLEEALAAFERTVLVDPKEADAYFEMGVIYQQRNDRVRALAAYKKAAELSPGDADYRKAVEGLSGAGTKP
jgi:tetratricopeptide (TPR) repeat protein